MVAAKLLAYRLMAAFAFLLALGAITAHAYISFLVLCFAVAVALCEASYWFSKTTTRRVSAFLFLLLLAAELGLIYGSAGA